ncbi:MgtC/SapB family protein, partial [Cetobacterium sp.]|uniref:MgtC/SapB family protein n=1 Tax=Cetobacterium sp. TaxID=2071632 RepID=UPI003EE5B882
MNSIEIISRLIFSIFIGSILGFERGAKHKPAGIITVTLVCFGATLITTTQEMIFYKQLALIKAEPFLSEVIKIDNTRIVAQIISGVGFIGAGTIFYTKGSVQGITTAALLWVAASIGIGIGYGFLKLNIISFICVLFILYGLKK